MQKSDTIGTLTKALSKAQGEFEHATKDTENSFFKSKYATLASIIDVAKKPLSDNGLAVFQTTDTDENGKVFLITVLSHESGEWVSGKYPVNPVKQDPQGFGSAMSYSRRYAFSAITGIAADDDDGNAASQNNDKKLVTQLVNRAERAAPGSMSRTIKPPEPGPEAIDEDGVVHTLNSPAAIPFNDYITDEQLMLLSDYVTAQNIPMSTQKAWLERAEINAIKDLPRVKAELLLNSLKDKQ